MMIKMLSEIQKFKNMQKYKKDLYTLMNDPNKIPNDKISPKGIIRKIRSYDNKTSITIALFKAQDLHLEPY